MKQKRLSDFFRVPASRKVRVSGHYKSKARRELKHEKGTTAVQQESGQHADLSKELLVISLGEKRNPKSLGNTHYVLLRDGSITNQENFKCHQTITTMFTKNHLEQVAQLGANIRPKLDQWVISPYDFNPSKGSTGSTLLGTSGPGANFQNDVIYYHSSALECYFNNFSQVATTLTVYVWRANGPSYFDPINQARVEVINESFNSVTASLPDVASIETLTAFKSAATGATAAGGVTGSAYMPDNVANNQRNIGFNGASPGTALSISEPYGIDILSTRGFKSKFHLCGSTSFVLQGGDQRKVHIQFAGGKFIKKLYSTGEVDPVIKGAYYVTVKTETGLVKKYSTDYTSVGAATVGGDRVPNFVRGSAEIGYQIVESHNMKGIAVNERIKIQQMTYLGTSAVATDTLGINSNKSGVVNAPPEVVLNDVDAAISVNYG